jgi:hypothetical protein
MPKYTKVTLTGPLARIDTALADLLSELQEDGTARLPIRGNGGDDDNVLLVLMDDDYGEGPEAALLATVEEKEE